MPIWKTRTIAEVPEITLVEWRVYETELGERHFVGYNLTESEGRVSSAIQSFDRDTLLTNSSAFRIPGRYP